MSNLGKLIFSPWLVLILSSVINDNEEQRDIPEILERRRNMPKTVHKIYLKMGGFLVS